jgi:hypothetical protein
MLDHGDRACTPQTASSMFASLISRTLLVLLVVSLCGSIAKAQCPSPAPPPSSIPWTPASPPKTVHLHWMANCVFEVEYCTRVVGGVTEYVITSIEADPTNTCTYDWDHIVQNIGPWFLGMMQGCGTPVPCEGTTPWPRTSTLYFATCWQIVNNADPTEEPKEECLICEDAGYCKVEYEFCCDALNHKYVQQVSSSKVIEGNCIGTAFPPSTWVYNQCYVMFDCD